MNSKELNNGEEEINLDDPAWKPLKSKRQIFEGTDAQFQSGSIANIESSKNFSSISNIKKFDIESGIVEQRKSAVIESKETTIEKTEPNIAAYRASSEAKQLRQLLENNSVTSPTKPIYKKELPLTPSKKLPPKPISNKGSDKDIQVSTENVNKLYDSMFLEIESAISDSNLELDLQIKPKPLPKSKPPALPAKPTTPTSTSSNPNSATASPVPRKKKLPPPPAVPSKPSTPMYLRATPIRPATPPKNSDSPLPPPKPETAPATPVKTPVKSTAAPLPPKMESAPATPMKKTSPAPFAPSETTPVIKKTLPPPPLPAENDFDDEMASSSPVPKKKALPPPPLPDKIDSPADKSASSSPALIKKTLPPPLPSENNSPSPSGQSPSSIIALQKKALMLKNKKKSLPPPPPGQPSPDDKRSSKTLELASQLSRSLSLNDGKKGSEVKLPQRNSTTGSMPPNFQIPQVSSTSPSNIKSPNLCDVAIQEDQDVVISSSPPKRNHSHRNYTNSMYSSKSTNHGHSKYDSEPEKLPDSLRGFFNEKEISENGIMFVVDGADEQVEDKKNTDDVISTGNRGFLFSKSLDQDSKKGHRKSKLAEVPDSMKLLFGGFGNVQELDSDSESENEDSISNVNVNSKRLSTSVASTTIPEDSTNVYLRADNEPKLYPSSNKDKNCRNSSIINASIVPSHEPPIPSLDKKPYRGNTLRWVINVNC